MNVEILPHIRDTAIRLGAGVPYALKVLTGRLADAPDMGRSSGLPGIFTVTVDGDLFEDCPVLAIGHIREPDRIEIRYVSRLASAESTADAPNQNQNQAAGAAAAKVPRRLITDAWQRITNRLQRNAPDSPAIQIPTDLHALWFLTAGDDGVNGAGRLPGNQSLMSLHRACVWTPRPATWAAGPATTKAPSMSSTHWPPTWKRPPTCSKPRPGPRGTGPAWSERHWCGAAGSTP